LLTPNIRYIIPSSPLTRCIKSCYTLPPTVLSEKEWSSHSELWNSTSHLKFQWRQDDSWRNKKWHPLLRILLFRLWSNLSIRTRFITEEKANQNISPSQTTKHATQPKIRPSLTSSTWHCCITWLRHEFCKELFVFWNNEYFCVYLYGWTVHFEINWLFITNKCT
jgi:hypothetical protein